MNKIKFLVVTGLIAFVGSIEIASRFNVTIADEDPLLKEVANHRSWTKVSSNIWTLDISSEGLSPAG